MAFSGKKSFRSDKSKSVKKTSVRKEGTSFHESSESRPKRSSKPPRDDRKFSDRKKSGYKSDSEKPRFTKNERSFTPRKNVRREGEGEFSGEQKKSSPSTYRKRSSDTGRDSSFSPGRPPRKRQEGEFSSDRRRSNSTDKSKYTRDEKPFTSRGRTKRDGVPSEERKRPAFRSYDKSEGNSDSERTYAPRRERSDSRFGDRPQRTPGKYRSRENGAEGNASPRFSKTGDKNYKKSESSRFDERKTRKPRSIEFSSDDSDASNTNSSRQTNFREKKESSFGERSRVNKSRTSFSNDRPSKERKKKNPEIEKDYGRPLRPKKDDFEIDIENKEIRLNRYLALAGIASRRDADKLIEAGSVKINGIVVNELGTKVQPGDVVTYNDSKISPEKKVYILLNKPKDFITTTEDPSERKTVMELVADACKERLFPIGRLDRNTTGVLLMTNDGDFAEKVSHPRYGIKKVYIASLDKNLSQSDRRTIEEGIDLEDGFIRPDYIDYLKEDDRKTLMIEIHSGKNHIIHRLFEHLGYAVVKLDRTAFGNLTKTGVKRGEYRFLEAREVQLLLRGNRKGSV